MEYNTFCFWTNQIIQPGKKEDHRFHNHSVKNNEDDIRQEACSYAQFRYRSAREEKESEQPHNKTCDYKDEWQCFQQRTNVNPSQFIVHFTNLLLYYPLLGLQSFPNRASANTATETNFIYQKNCLFVKQLHKSTSEKSTSEVCGTCS